jgi:hypothetical protein
VTGLAATGGSAHAAGSHASRGASRLVVTIRSSAQGIHLSDTKIRPGNTMFKVAPHGRGGDLQVLRLRQGYSLTQAFTDIGKAFQGDIPSIKRVDKNIVFYGGNSMSPRGGKATFWGVNLDKTGTYYVLNVDNNKLTTLKVKGTHQRRALPSTSGKINMADAADGVTNVFKPGKHIARHGFMSTTNKAEEPHFVDLLHVKKSTTNKQVRDYFSSGAPGQPPFAAKDGAAAATGVISPGKRFVWSYSLPRGKFLVTCFWPSKLSGMPHAFMGMWKLFNIG